MPDQLRKDISAVIQSAMRQSDAIDYRALYGAVILESDGTTASVKPNVPELGNTLSDCRIRRPTGLTDVPVAGAACLLGWEGGDPSLRYVLLLSDSGDAESWTIDCDVTVQGDLASEHEVGISSGPLSATPATPTVVSATAAGDDTAFDLTFSVPNMQTLSPGGKVADVELARDFASAPKCTVTAKHDATWPGAACFTYTSSAPKTVSIYYQGSAPIPGPLGPYTVTVFVRG